MTDVNDNLDRALNTTFVPETNTFVVAPEPEKHLPAVVQKEEAPDATIDEDFNKSRDTLNNLLDFGNEAVDGIMEVAKESQHPRAYEVAATLINTVAGVTEKLMQLQKAKQDLTKKDEPVGGGDVNIDKAVFVGSTKDLLAHIKSSQ